jgi:outer membrane protein TolC
MLQVERAEHQVTIAQSARRPAVDLVGSVSRNNNTAQTYQKEESALYFRATWAINMGGEFQKRELAAVTDGLEARAKAESALSKVKESVRIAWNQAMQRIRPDMPELTWTWDGEMTRWNDLLNKSE